jgi:serine/threonine protein kinase
MATRGLVLIDASRLELGSSIGQGATCIAYKAKLSDKSYAAKIFKTEALNSNLVIAEITTLSKVGTHPNVVEFFGASISKAGIPTLLFELVEGRDLERHLSFQKPGFDLGKQTVHRWSLDILSALDFLHDRDPIIIHCDVKPANLILTPCLTSLKLTDFGIAKTVARDRRLVESFPANEGSPRYRAPEMLSSSDSTHYTEKVDVYSAAIVICLLLTGRRPDNERRPTPAARWRWRALSDLLERMWAHNPAQRPSAGECAVQLRSLAALEAERPARGIGCYAGIASWRTRRLAVA